MNPVLWRLLLDLVLLIVVRIQITSVSDVLAEDVRHQVRDRILALRLLL